MKTKIHKESRANSEYHKPANLIRGFGKVFKSEFYAQFSLGVIVGMIFVSLFPLIGPLASGEFGPNEAPSRTVAQLAQAITQSVFFNLVIRLVIIFRERTTVDRNRTIYLKYDKNTVLLGKTIVDVLTFIPSVVFVTVAASAITVFKNKGTLNESFYGDMVVYVIAIMFLYAVMSMGIRWAVSSISKKSTKGIVIALVVLFTAGLFTVLSIVGVLDEDMKNAVIDNKYVFAFIPFVNISVFPYAITSELPSWTMIPFIFEMLIVIAIMWRSLAKNLKAFLAA